MNDSKSCQTPSTTDVAIRHKVGYRYDALNVDFLKRMAEIAAYAGEKYGVPEQYTTSRLVEDRSPINHIYEHLRQYQLGETYDHFDGDPRYHLAAVAYNAMMEYFFHTKWGHQINPIAIRILPIGPSRMEPRYDII